jgi:hypothetical protein
MGGDPLHAAAVKLLRMKQPAGARFLCRAHERACHRLASDVLPDEPASAHALAVDLMLTCIRAASEPPPTPAA